MDVETTELTDQQKMSQGLVDDAKPDVVEEEPDDADDGR